MKLSNKSGLTKLALFSLVFLLTSSISCSQLKKRSDSTPQESTGAVAPSLEQPAPEVQQSPVPISNQAPKRVALILGGGGARTLAHAGILRALTREKIEISHVAGVEWASLVAASFASSGQTHDMDWKLYKLDALDLKFGSGGFFGIGGKKSIQDLSEYFSANFAKANAESSKVHFSCTSQTVGSSSAKVLTSGNLGETLKQCIPYPPFFDVGRSVAGNASVWNLVKTLQKEGAEVIVFIDVLTPAILNDPLIKRDKLTTLLWAQTMESNQMVKSLVKNSFTIPLDRFSMFDFSKRKQIEEAGEKAGVEIAKRLKSQYPL